MSSTATTIDLHDAINQVTRFGVLFEPTDWLEARLIHRDKGKDAPHPRSVPVPAGKLPSIVKQLASDNASGFNIYLSINPRRTRGAKGDAGVLLARCLFVDFDHCAVEAARRRIVDAGIPTPTLIVNSGHGAHAYWRLTEPLTDLAAWTETQKDLIALLGTDTKIFNPERLMRLPGFLNLKGEPVPVRIVEVGNGR